MNRRKQIYIFFLAVGVLAAGSGIHESIFNNFLSDAHQLTAGKRGFLELPREAPGFLVVLMAGLLCMLPDTRIGLIGAATLAAGMFGMAMLGHAYSWMFAMMIVASAGMHLMMPINSSIAVALSDSESRGKRLGQLGAIQTAGMMIGSGLVYLFLGKTDPKYSLGFAAVGAAALVGAIVYGSMHVPDLHRRKPRLVLRRKFWLYYLLEFAFGARKQIFITFGPWVLIKIYGLPATDIAMLFFIASFLGIGFKPLAGLAIDRFGERKVIFTDGFVLIFVCLGYGYAGFVAPSDRAALIMAGVCFVVDDLLFSLSSARVVFVSRISDSPQETTSTLAMGVSINHIASMVIPLIAGGIWAGFGYERVFLCAAALALGISGLALMVPRKQSVASAATEASAA